MRSLRVVVGTLLSLQTRRKKQTDEDDRGKLGAVVESDGIAGDSEQLILQSTWASLIGVSGLCAVHQYSILLSGCPTVVFDVQQAAGTFALRREATRFVKSISCSTCRGPRGGRISKSVTVSSRHVVPDNGTQHHNVATTY